MELRAEVVAIGDEITSGVRLDTNSQWISQELGKIGIQVAFHSTVGDELNDNVAVFQAAVNRADIVVSTGGLGPTADDLTRHAIAEMAGVELVKDEAVLEHIETMYTRRGREMPVNNEIQAWFPSGTSVVNNPEGTAPGIDFAGQNVNGKEYRIFALPGVPVEVKQMWSETVEKELRGLVGEEFVIHHHTIHCFGSGESHIETLLPDLVKRGRDPSVGITASSATISLRVSTRAKSIEDCEVKMQPTIDTINDCLGDLVYGQNGIQLQDVCAELLNDRKTKLGVLDFGLNGEVLKTLRAAGVANHLVDGNSKSELIGKPPKNSTELESLGERLLETEECQFVILVSPINRDEDLIAEGKSVYRVAIVTKDAAETKEFRFGGHSGWREVRAVKEVLNCLRLYLLKRVS